MKTSRLVIILLILFLSTGMVRLILASAHSTGKDNPPTSDLSASTLTAPVKVQLDQPITYTIALVNMGGILSGTVLSDAIPYGTSYKPGSLQCSDGNCWFDSATNAIRWEGGLSSSPFPKTRFFFTTLDGTNTVYMAEFIREGWFITGTWRTVGTFTVPEITDTIGIDYDGEHGVLYHSDASSNQIVVTDLNGTFLGQFQCLSASGFNSGITYLEWSSPPEVWVTDFASNLTTRCEAPDIYPPASQPASPHTPGDIIEVFTNTWGSSTFGLVFNPLEGIVRYAHEGLAGNGASIWDIATISHTVILSTSLSDMNPEWNFLWNKRNGIEWDASTNTYFLPDYNGSLNIDDNLIEINSEGVILNAWELDGSSNDSYDGSAIDKVIDLAIVPVHPVTITFAIQVVAASSDSITNVVSIAHSTFTTPITLTATTEIVENLYYSGDFENNNGNFSSIQNSDWQWGIPSSNYLEGPPQAHSGLKVWGTNLLGDANDEIISHTLSLSITLPVSPTSLYLQWWDWYGTDGDDSRSILINGTEIWNDGGGDSQPAWVNHSLDLSAWAGQQVLLEFRLNTCCTNPGPPGWYLDDIALDAPLLPPDLEVSGLPVEINVIQNSHRTGYFDIYNAGSLGLQWSVTEWPVTTTETIPWITAITPPEGIVGKNDTQPIGITFDAAGLTPGIYTGTLQLTTNDVNALTYPFSVRMIVTEPIIYLPIVWR